MSDAIRTQPRRLRILLRDYRMLEAGLALPAGQSLLSFLAGRKTYLTLHDAAWVATGERIESAALRTDRVLWIVAVDENLPLVNGRLTAEPRAVELLLEGGMLVSGGLSLASVQRLPDYLESAGAFIAIRDAVLVRSGRPARPLDLALGDIALNHEAVQAAWEAAAREASTGAPSSEAFPDLAPNDAADTHLAQDEAAHPVDRGSGPDGFDGAEPFGSADAGPLDGFEGHQAFDVTSSAAFDGYEEHAPLDGLQGQEPLELEQPIGATASAFEETTDDGDGEDGKTMDFDLDVESAGEDDPSDGDLARDLALGLGDPPTDREDDEDTRPVVHGSDGWV